ncbi:MULTISPECIES: single-stranded DNA-binding protein [Aerosakkonema]|uniref:single-stranded DNA-binding protein n=1 Tax=Aerosakkonema TaxID=1246629 RepID=UPI0035BAF380
MNSCILMAEVVEEPQLRYTPGDSQVAVAEMFVQFPSQREEDPPYTIKVVGRGNLAQEVHQRCHRGDRIIIEGRLSIVTFERRQENFKEKRAELTAQKIHYLGSNDAFPTATTSGTPISTASTTSRNTTNYVGSESYSSTAATATVPPVSTRTVNMANISSVDDDEDEPIPTAKKQSYQSQSIAGNQPDVDDIPF